MYGPASLSDSPMSHVGVMAGEETHPHVRQTHTNVVADLTIQRPSLAQGFFHAQISSSHLLPPNPSRQVQLNPSALSMQVPPCAQVLGPQWTISEENVRAIRHKCNYITYM